MLDSLKPPTLHAWLAAELDKKLASLPDDHARWRELILQGNAWKIRYDKFVTFGIMPFGEPHPVYGWMTATDFVILFANIEARKTALERARPLPTITSPAIAVGDHMPERADV